MLHNRAFLRGQNSKLSQKNESTVLPNSAPIVFSNAPPRCSQYRSTAPLLKWSITIGIGVKFCAEHSCSLNSNQKTINRHCPGGTCQSSGVSAVGCGVAVRFTSDASSSSFFPVTRPATTATIRPGSRGPVAFSLRTPLRSGRGRGPLKWLPPVSSWLAMHITLL